MDEPARQETVPLSPEEIATFRAEFARIANEIGKSIRGKEQKVDLVLIGLFAGGHVLLDDVPGTGKTQLAVALGKSIAAEHARVQFTPDLLPSDVTGVSVWNQVSLTFDFKPGPIFTNILLADEINRASPKTQSALLQVMEEAQVAVDGDNVKLTQPFMIIATQNPVEMGGTYPLPEAQLDRFLIATSLGHLEGKDASRVLMESGTRDRSNLVGSVTTGERVQYLKGLAERVNVEESIVEYVLRIVEATRKDPDVRFGASLRGALALVRASKARALSQGRGHVTADDIKALAEPVLAHRLILTPEARFDRETKGDEIVKRISRRVETPDTRTR